MSRPPLPLRADPGWAPLSFAQRSIWRTEQRFPGTALHNETAAFRLIGPVDADALERALAVVAVDREALRCCLAADGDGEPVQRFAPVTRPSVRQVDLSALPERERTERLAELVGAAARAPFDLFRPPLLRTHLFRLGADEHLLLFIAHHLVVDAWGFGVFLESLASAYRDVLDPADHASPKPTPVRPDLGDFAAWQRSTTGSGDERDLGHWRVRFAGEPPLIHFPTDPLARYGVPTGAPVEVAGAVHRFTVPAEVAAELSRWGRTELASLPAVVLTAFGAVLRRFTGKDDLLVGMPVATRNRPALAGVIGPLLNLMAHRIELAGAPTFRHALRRTRDALKADLRHRGTPFDLVVDGVRSHLGWSPAFRLMYAFHSGPATGLRLPGVDAVAAPSHSGTAKYDLSLFVRPQPSGELEFALEYRTAVLSADSVEGIGDALRGLLGTVAGQADQPLGELPAPAPDQQPHVAAGDPTGPSWSGVPGVLGAVAERDGGAPAVISSGQSFTRAEADRAADRVAARLAGTHAIVPGDRVALSVRRCAALVPLITGLWRAGAVLVPLDEALPAARAEHVLRDSGAELLITDQQAGPSTTEPDGLPRVEAAELLAAGRTGPVPFPQGPAPDALAYLMYTSGSTGRPKGVAVPHGCLANLLHSITEQPGIGEQDVLLAVTPITFDIALLELFAPLVVGGRVVVAWREQVRDVTALSGLLDEHHVTLMQATPSLWRGLVDGGWTGRPQLRALSGGEPLDPALAARLLDRCAQVWNLYGPTETTIWSTLGRVRPGEPVTIGRPVTRTTCYLLDGDRRPVPRGAVGELVIGGAGVSAGYWNRPELTAKVFVPDPVDPAAGTVYRTGDLARQLADGRLLVLGRADQQVKILGHRIETGEVEAHLRDHPLVRHAAVVVDRDHPAGLRLVAFVVRGAVDGTTGRNADLPAVLRGHLRERLPAAVVPAITTEVPELPLNSSGKIDRPALLALARDLAAGPRTEPATDAERVVAELWASALGLGSTQVGRFDDFLALGGNSITATRLLAKTRRTLGAAPSLAEFYADPTPAALAAAAGGPDAAPASRTPRPRPAVGDTVPLTDQQRQLWLLHSLDPGSPAYNLSARIRLTGPLDVTALDSAVGELATRHDILGARCGLVDGRPVLLRRPARTVQLAVADLPELSDADVERRITEAAEAEASAPFALDEGPLLRATLLRAANGVHELLLTAHHLAVDGWSVGVALRELTALYAARTGGEAAPPPPSLTFAEHAVDIDDPAARAVRDEQVAYWAERLAGYPGQLDLGLATDHDRSMADRPAASTVPFDLDREPTARLRAIAARLRSTPFTVLVTAFATLLGRYAGTDDVVVGIPVANRSRSELDDVVGSLVNTLPVRIDLSATRTFADLVARTGRTLAADLDRPLVPMDQLVSTLGTDHDPSRPALIQAALVLQDAPPTELRFGGVRGEVRAVGTGVAKYDLTLALDEHPDRLTGVLEHASARFAPADAMRFATHLNTLLAAALADPSRCLDDVELSDSVAPSARPSRPPGAARREHQVPLHLLVGRQAVATPDAVAIRDGGGVLDYRGLAAWRDRIAAEVLAHGGGPGSFVAVLVPTGAMQSAAVLGVAQAGAAFVVLDPADSDLRIEDMLRDVEPACVLGTERTLAAHPGLWNAEVGEFGGRPVAVTMETGPIDAATNRTAEDAETAHPSAGPTPAVVSGNDPLCLVYTSGSSGRPKGIVHSHATFAQLADFQRRELGIRAGCRIAQWAPFTYDAAYTEVFLALCSSAVLCVPPDGLRRDPAAMVDWLRSERIEVFETVPGFFGLVTAALDDLGGSLPDLRHVLLSGEPLPTTLAAAWAHRPSGPRLHNNYGPTECVLATHRVLSAGEDFAGSVPIGRPIPGREVLVLDHRGRPCPVGVRGEVHLRSDFLAGCYHRRPEEDERAYRADPWQPGGWLYRTGDLARRLPDGDLEFLGRRGRQVKIRGNRVELDGVEAVLENHPRVREAAATVHGENEARRLIGYAVVAAPDITGADLRAYLAERLPPAAVPDTVRLLESMPRTRSNKRDRAQLPVPDAPEATADAPPREGLEQLVADAWRSVLGTGPIGRHTNFFEAGGNSMLAATLQLELGRRLRRDIRLVEVFTRPTIAEFAAGLDSRHDTPEPGSSAAESRGERRRRALRRGTTGRGRAGSSTEARKP